MLTSAGISVPPPPSDEFELGGDFRNPKEVENLKDLLRLLAGAKGDKEK